MRILTIYRHYWPDTTPYARLLKAILEDQVVQGRQATVLTAVASYNYIKHANLTNNVSVGGFEVRRLRLLPERKHWKILRFVNYSYFLIRAMLHAIFIGQYDIIVANSHPPLLIGIALRLIHLIKGTPFVIHYQDIHPESALIAGQLKENWFYRQLINIDSNSCSKAKIVVTLSSEMNQTLIAREGVSKEKIRIINNFPLDIYDELKELPKIFCNSTPNIYRVLFAGNMGVYQDLPRLVEAAALLKDIEEIQFIFMGAGAEKSRLYRIAGTAIGRTIHFEPFYPVEIAFACMKRADLGVISLKKELCRVAYPSKTMTYLAAGCPLLALTEPDSQLAQDVISNNFGYVPNNLSPEGIATVIKLAFQERLSWSPEARKDLTKKSNQVFGKNIAIAAWRELFKEIENSLLIHNKFKNNATQKFNKAA